MREARPKTVAIPSTPSIDCARCVDVNVQTQVSQRGQYIYKEQKV